MPTLSARSPRGGTRRPPSLTGRAAYRRSSTTRHREDPVSDPLTRPATSALLRRFPVTVLLGTQVLVMIVLPAVLKQTEPLGLILGICAAAIACSGGVELLLRPVGEWGRPARVISLRSARVIFGIGAMATIATVVGGQGSYAVQLGIGAESALSQALSPFTVWLVFGVALHLWLFSEAVISARHARLVVAVACGLQLWAGLSRAVMGGALSLILTMIVLSVFVGLIRPRLVVVGALLVPVLWPLVAGVRDASRASLPQAAAAAVAGTSALDRLQLDEQMAAVGVHLPATGELKAPDVAVLLRIGLVPGFLDPGRPSLDTRTRMNAALGGSSTSAYSATLLGDLYLFEGWQGVVVVTSVLTLAVGLTVRRRNPWSLALLGLLLWHGLSFSATYPDLIPRVLQGLESMLAAFLVVRVLGAGTSRRSARRRARAPGSRIT